MGQHLATPRVVFWGGHIQCSNFEEHIFYERNQALMPQFLIIPSKPFMFPHIPHVNLLAKFIAIAFAALA